MLVNVVDSAAINIDGGSDQKMVLGRSFNARFVSDRLLIPSVPTRRPQC